MNTTVLTAAAVAALAIRAALRRPRNGPAVATRQELEEALALLAEVRHLGSDIDTATDVLHQIPDAVWPVIRDAVAAHDEPAIYALADWLDPTCLDQPGISPTTALRALFAAEVHIRRQLRGER